MKPGNPKHLSQLAKTALEKPSYYKAALNMSYAQLIWPVRLQEWKDQSPVAHGMHGFPGKWFCVPEFREKRQRIELKVWDSTHLLMNLRRVVCSPGTNNLKRNAWLRAADDPLVKLKRQMVEDLPDKQEIGFALLTYASDVEEAMKREGFHNEANFCRLVRNWWYAEDEPGLSAKTSVKFRLELRDFFLQDVNFKNFSPFTDNVKGNNALFDLLFIFH